MKCALLMGPKSLQDLSGPPEETTNAIIRSIITEWDSNSKGVSNTRIDTITYIGTYSIRLDRKAWEAQLADSLRFLLLCFCDQLLDHRNYFLRIEILRVYDRVRNDHCVQIGGRIDPDTPIQSNSDFEGEVPSNLI